MQYHDFEVFCQNLDCGETVVHHGRTNSIKTKEHRKLRYVGPIEPGPGVTVHQYVCPVCSKKRLFGNAGQGFEEVSADEFDELMRINSALKIFNEMNQAFKIEEERILKTFENRPVTARDL